MAQKRDNLNALDDLRVLHQFGGEGWKGPYQFDCIKGICTLNGKILVGTKHAIRVFDWEGRFIHQFGSYGVGPGEFNDLSGICTFQDKIVVSDYYRQRIQIFSSNYKYIRSIPLLGFQPTIICATLDGLLFVANDRGQVFIFHSNGQREGKCDGDLGLINGICCNQRDEIIVASGSQNRIIIFNKQGTLLRSTGSTENQPRYFWNPHGLSVDWQGNILLGDEGNHRILIFDSDLNLLKQISLEEPRHLLIIHRRMIVATNTRITIFSN